LDVPSIEWNRETWDRTYDWSALGDEWSAAWGSAARQWHWTLRPRLSRYLPAGSILEIGPGYGRWTQFLLPECRDLVLVDLSASCIEACRQRFAGSAHVRYVVNDGSSLAALADDSIDLAFSFDSLVHAEHDALAGYIGGLATKLKPGGTAVLHHSNLGQFGYFKRLRAIERRLGGTAQAGPAPSGAVTPGPAEGDAGPWRRLVSAVARTAARSGLFDRTHMRALSVSAERVRELALAHGLNCTSQEIVPWGGSRRAIDCISVLSRGGSNVREYRRLVNDDFMREADRVKRIGGLYD
jgi:SAM-dependent methyltransferase